MDISPWFFYGFSGLAIASAFCVILSKNAVSSALSLIVVFFCLSGIYALLDAHLIAALQVIVYAGAVMVLFIFVILLLNADLPLLDQARTSNFLKAITGGLIVSVVSLFIVVFQKTVLLSNGVFTSEKIEAAGGNTQVISELLFSEYILPFEITSVLLLAGIVGSVLLAKRR